MNATNRKKTEERITLNKKIKVKWRDCFSFFRRHLGRVSIRTVIAEAARPDAVEAGTLGGGPNMATFLLHKL